MDGIPVEVWKCLGEEGIDMLWDLMQGIYGQEKISTEWRDNSVIIATRVASHLARSVTLGITSLWLDFLAVTPHAAPTNGKAPRS